MAQKKTKKQKRDIKKKREAKASATRQHKVNKAIKAHSFIEAPSAISFIEPPKFYIGCTNEFIGDAEYAFMVSDGNYVEGIEVAIYPATESFNRFIKQRMLDEEQETPSLEGVNWIVVKLKSMLYIDSFIELGDAKQYVQASFPNVKVFRLDSLGTKDLPYGEIEFAPMPCFESSTEEEWIDFALQSEDALGFRFDADDAIDLLLQDLVDANKASLSLVEEFCERGSVVSALDFADSNGLNGVKVGIHTLQSFHENYARLRDR